MTRLVTRERVFSRSRLADYYISATQNPYSDPKTENSETENIVLEYEYMELEDSSFDDDCKNEDGNEYSWEERHANTNVIAV